VSQGLLATDGWQDCERADAQANKIYLSKKQTRASRHAVAAGAGSHPSDR
jgi:hypothetical protein